jgi:hypothetical protein
MAETRIVVGDEEPGPGWSRLFTLDTSPVSDMRAGGRREFFAQSGTRLSDIVAERDLPFEIVMDFLDRSRSCPESRVHLDTENEGGNENG